MTFINFKLYLLYCIPDYNKTKISNEHWDDWIENDLLVRTSKLKLIVCFEGKETVL